MLTTCHYSKSVMKKTKVNLSLYKKTLYTFSHIFFVCWITFQNVRETWMDGWMKMGLMGFEAGTVKQRVVWRRNSGSTRGYLTVFTFSVMGHSYNTMNESCMEGSRKETVLQPKPKPAVGPFLSFLELKIQGAWKTFSKVYLQSSILSESQTES